MSDFESSAARRFRLASELRRLRRRARLTGKDVAIRLGWSEAKLSRIENGQTRVKIVDLHKLMDLYEVSGPDRGALVALAEESRETDALAELEGDVPEGHTQILQTESEAEVLWNWEPQVVPGLLQVEDYTRAVLQLYSDLFARPAGEVERRIETRRLRQNVLTRTPSLESSFVIDQSVLLRGFAAPGVMYHQLIRLAELSEQSNIDLRILPLEGDQLITTGAFVYYRFRRIHGVSRPETIALEHMQGTIFVDSELDVNAYKRVFKAVRDRSLSSQASRDLLAQVAHDAWS